MDDYEPSENDESSSERHRQCSNNGDVIMNDKNGANVLHENQHLAIEMTAENGVKYWYLLQDKISVEQLHFDGQIQSETAIVIANSLNERQLCNVVNTNAKSDEKLDILKHIEDRSCGTMTEENYLESDEEEEKDESTVSHDAPSLVTMKKTDTLPINKTVSTEKEKKEASLISLTTAVIDTGQSLEADVSIMNEMKIASHNTGQDTSNNDKNDEEFQRRQSSDGMMEENAYGDSVIQNQDSTANDPSTADKNLKQVIENDIENDSLQLDHIDDETCKEITANIEIEDDRDEEMKTVDEKDVKSSFKFQYERPTTRMMTRRNMKENEGQERCNKRKKTKNYYCEICEKSYLNKSSFQEHIKTHEIVPLSCNICSKVFKGQRKLSNHIKRHSSDKPHLCDMCGKAFRIKETLENHMYTHLDVEKPFKCNECDLAFIKKHYLIRHATCHTGEKPFPCRSCDKKFRTKGDLQRHERIHGENPLLKQYTCKKCGKRFCAENGLLRHERAHKGEKPYPCTECSKCFSMPADLKRHLKTHSGGEYLQCDLCSKVLTSKVGFKRHQRMHSGEKPYKCKSCGDKFIDQWSLIKHEQKNHYKKDNFQINGVIDINKSLLKDKFSQEKQIVYEVVKVETGRK